MTKSLKDLLLESSDSQLDASMFPLIAKWDDPPTSLQLLEVIDHCIYSSLSSGFILRVLQSMYASTCEKEGITHEHNELISPWRYKAPFKDS